MNIFFAGSKGKTGSIIFKHLKSKGYKITNEINEGGTSLKAVITPNSIVIDFTNKETAYNHALICLENNSHLICGTTGLSNEQISFLKERAENKNLHFIFNPNFSLGIAKIIPLLNNLSKHYKSKIIESHHISKKDLPSGTALLLKEHLCNNTPIESIRTTYTSLDHTIILTSDYEEITITHSIKDKLAYALGVENVLNSLLESKKYD